MPRYNNNPEEPLVTFQHRYTWGIPRGSSSSCQMPPLSRQFTPASESFRDLTLPVPAPCFLMSRFQERDLYREARLGLTHLKYECDPVRLRH